MPKKVTTTEVEEQANVETSRPILDVDIAIERRLVALHTLQLVVANCLKPSRISKTRLPVYRPESTTSRPASTSKTPTSASATRRWSPTKP